MKVINQLSVGVVIVTYNRIKLLEITLCKVFSQSYPNNIEVLIVDNGSTDGTKEFLEEHPKVLKLFMPENLGPAGGFHEGIKFYNENRKHDAIWLMDDDFFPNVNCLEELVNRVNQDTVVFPWVRLKSMKTHNLPSWSGVLIPTSIIHKVGYPRKELFFWAEDTEYLQVRIVQKYGYSAKWVQGAKGVHFTERKTNHRLPWKYYYETRNMIFVRVYLQNHPLKIRAYRLTRSWMKLLLLIVIRENNKLRKLLYFFKGTLHGFQGKLGKIVEPNAR